MKKITVFFLSLILLFSFAGCSNTDRKMTNEEKYILAKTMIETAGDTLKTEATSAANSYAMQLILDADASISSSVSTINVSANAKAQVKFDFNNINASQAFMELSATYPKGEDFTIFTDNLGLYYKDEFLYKNGAGYKTKETVSFDSLGITQGANYINELLELASTEINSQLADMVTTDINIEEFDFNITDLINQIIPSSDPMAILIKEKLIDKLGNLKPYEIFDYTVSDKQVKFSLNYINLKKIIIDIFDTLKAEINSYIDNTETFMTEIMTNTAIAKYITSTAFHSVVSLIDDNSLENIFTIRFINIDNTEFKLLMSYISDGTYTASSFIEAAEYITNHFYQEKMADWFIGNSEISSFVTTFNYTAEYDTNFNYMIGEVLKDLQRGISDLNNFKQCIPAVFKYETIINFSKSMIKDINIDIESALMLPSKIFQKSENTEPQPTVELINIGIVSSFKLSIETDQSKINIEYPANLNDYTEN